MELMCSLTPPDVLVEQRDGIAIARAGDHVLAKSEDHSYVLVEAINRLRRTGGGLLVIKSGVYKLVNVPLYSNISIVGVGLVDIELFETSKSVFVAGDRELSRVYMCNLDLKGGGEGVAVDLESAERASNVTINGLRITGFKVSIRDAPRSDRLTLKNTSISNCEVGVYARSERLVVIDSEFRNCKVGLGGWASSGRVEHAVFAHNTYGVKGLDGGSFKSTLFYNCEFIDNEELSIELGLDSKLVYSRLSSKRSSISVQALGANVIEGCFFGPGNFRECVVATSGDGVSILNNVFQSVRGEKGVICVDGGDVLIAGNRFNDVVGKVVVLRSRYAYPIIAYNHFKDIEGVAISVEYEVRAPLIALNQVEITRDFQVLSHAENSASYFPIVIGNAHYIEVSPSKPLYQFTLKAPGLVYANNMLRALVWKGVKAVVLDGDLRGGVVKNNVFSGVSVLSDNVIYDDNTKVEDNYVSTS